MDATSKLMSKRLKVGFDAFSSSAKSLVLPVWLAFGSASAERMTKVRMHVAFVAHEEIGSAWVWCARRPG